MITDALLNMQEPPVAISAVHAPLRYARVSPCKGPAPRIYQWRDFPIYAQAMLQAAALCQEMCKYHGSIREMIADGGSLSTQFLQPFCQSLPFAVYLILPANRFSRSNFFQSAISRLILIRNETSCKAHLAQRWMHKFCA
jgi:hypothetical protein